MRLKTQLLFLVVILALFSVEESFAKRRGGGSRGGSRSRSSASSRGWYVFFTPYYLYDSCIFWDSCKIQKGKMKWLRYPLGILHCR